MTSHGLRFIIAIAIQGIALYLNCLLPNALGKMPGASFVKIMWNCSTYRLLSPNCALNQEVAEQVTLQVLLEIASDRR